MSDAKKPFTEQEEKIMNLLNQAIIEYSKLNPWTPDSADEFAEGIKKSQTVLMERVLKRDYPEHFV